MSDTMLPDPEQKGRIPLTPVSGTGLWFNALKTADLDGYLSLYDTAQFKFSGGDFGKWRDRARTYFARNRGASYKLDTIWRTIAPPPLIETRLRLTMVSGSDTLRIIKALSWKNGNDGWKIIGDQTGRAR